MDYNHWVEMGISIYLNTFNGNCKEQKLIMNWKYALNDDCHEEKNFINGKLIKRLIWNSEDFKQLFS